MPNDLGSPVARRNRAGWWILTVLIFAAALGAITCAHKVPGLDDRTTPWEGYVVAGVLVLIWVVFIRPNRPR
jgi:hypothetical protein